MVDINIIAIRFLVKRVASKNIATLLLIYLLKIQIQ